MMRIWRRRARARVFRVLGSLDDMASHGLGGPTLTDSPPVVPQTGWAHAGGRLGSLASLFMVALIIPSLDIYHNIMSLDGWLRVGMELCDVGGS